MTRQIRVLLVDDQRLMRDGLRTLLELEPDLEVVGEAGDGQAALETYAAVQPDVVLMDIRMPLMYYRMRDLLRVESELLGVTGRNGRRQVGNTRKLSYILMSGS